MTIAAGQTASAADILKSLNASGYLDFASATELTIASGAVTNTQNYHLIDTESDAASDDLDTITAAASVTDGFVLVIAPASDARTVVVKHNTGNILCPGGVDITLDDAHDYCVLFYSGALTKWAAYPAGALPAYSTSGNVLRSTGSAWASSNIGVPLITRLTAQVDYTSTTLANITDFVQAINANENWIVEWELYVSGQAVTGLKFAVTVPSGATLMATAVFMDNGGFRHAAGTTTSGGGMGVTSDIDVVRVVAHVRNSTNAGNIQLQAAANASSSTSSIYVNSYQKAIRYG